MLTTDYQSFGSSIVNSMKELISPKNYQPFVESQNVSPSKAYQTLNTEPNKPDFKNKKNQKIRNISIYQKKNSE